MNKVKLWIWKWFIPRKYIHHLAEQLVAAHEKGLDNGAR